MSSIIKRGRGRPVGTGTDDKETLNKMADLIAADPSVRAATAAKRILRAPHPSTIRRLQVKWRASGVEYLAAAKVRREAAVPTPARWVAGTHPHRTSQFISMQLAMQGEANARAREIAAMMNSPAMLAIRESTRRHMESPEVLALQKVARIFEASPGMKAMKELHNSPEMRKLQQIQLDPRLLAFQETLAGVGKDLAAKMAAFRVYDQGKVFSG